MRVLACTSDSEMWRGEEDFGSCFHCRGVKNLNYSNLMRFLGVSLPRARKPRTSLRDKTLLDVGQGWLVSVTIDLLLPQYRRQLRYSSSPTRPFSRGAQTLLLSCYRFESWQKELQGVENSKGLPHGTVRVCLSTISAVLE